MNKNTRPGDYPKGPVIILGLLLTAHLVFCIAVYSGLPSEIPVHFGPHGADRMETKTLLTWLSLWIVNFLLTLSLGATALLLFKIPLKYINMPQKDAFMELAPPAQHRILYLSSYHTLVLTITSCATLFVTQISIYGYTIGELDRFPTELLVVAGVAFVCEVFLMVTALTRTVKDEIENATPGGTG